MKRVSVVILILISLSGCSTNSEYLPQEIFNLSLSRKMAGTDASEFLNKLHFQNVTNAKTEIGFYKGESGDAIIYLTYYSTREKAVKFEQQMTDKISAKRTPFILGEYMEIEGIQIYRTFGMGQTHFVFSHNDVLIWLSLGTKWANDFLKDYLAMCRTN